MTVSSATIPSRTSQLSPLPASGPAVKNVRDAVKELSLLLFSACAVLAVTGCNASLGATVDRTEESTVDPSGIRRIMITTDNGDVDVDAGTGDIEIDALIAEHDKGDGEWTVDVAGDTLVVTGTCDAGWFDRCAVGFRITVPAGLDVTVQTNNGDIDLQGLSGSIDLTTNNGEIDGTRIDAGSVQATSDNGDVNLTFSTAPDDVVAYSDNGDVTIEVPPTDDDYQVDASSDNGHVQVAVPTDPQAQRTINAESGNGNVHARYPAG